MFLTIILLQRRKMATKFSHPKSSGRVIHPVKDHDQSEVDPQDQEDCSGEQEANFTEAVGDLKSLLVYAKATSIKPWDWGAQKATSVTQMFSFGECKAEKLCTNDRCGLHDNTTVCIISDSDLL